MWLAAVIGVKFWAHLLLFFSVLLMFLKPFVSQLISPECLQHVRRIIFSIRESLNLLYRVDFFQVLRGKLG